MHQEEYIKRISNLLIKSLNSELSSEEAEELEVWKQKLPANAALCEKILHGTDWLEYYPRYRQAVDSDDWKQLQRKMMKRKPAYRLRTVVVKYAAVVVLLFSVAFYLFQSHEEPQQSGISMVEITPGSPKAILELSDGQRVYLEKGKSSNQKLLENYGIQEADSSLSYHARQTEWITEYHTLIVPRGGEYILSLEDGSKVWINSESVLKYPVRFSATERKIFLLEGEAYFKVFPDKMRPFEVEAGEVAVRVTGTEFNVMAYKSANHVETTLTKGGVDVLTGEGNQHLQPGEQAVFSKETGGLTKRAVNIAYYTSWKEGVFEFDDMPLWEVAEQLGRWYDVDFVFQNEKIGAIRFSGAIKKSKSLEFILDIIRETRALDYRIKGKTVIIQNR